MEDAFVVGVGGLLAGVDGQRPVGEFRVDPLHGQVCALDQAHFDFRATSLNTRTRKFTQALDRRQGVREIRLDDDPG